MTNFDRVNQSSNLEQARQLKESDIFSNNFGGLNTLASPLNIPYEDTPYCLNTEVLISGAITKRKGTRVIFKETGLSGSNVGGIAVIPFSTGLGYNYIINKRRRDIRVFSTQASVTTLLMTKADVWDVAGGNIRATYINIPDIEPKIIFCTGVNPPVELKFVERSTTVTSGIAFTTVVFSDVRLANATTSNIIVYQDRVRKTDILSAVYSAGNLTVTFSGSIIAGTYTFDIALVIWHWYAEAFRYDGNRFSKSGTQLTSQVFGGTGNFNDPDQVVAIPESLRDDLSIDVNGNYPVRAYISTAYNDIFTLSTSREPTTADAYAHSDGTPYKQAAGKKVNPSPLFITFGREFVPAASTDGQSRGIQFSRRRRLLFNGASTILGTDLRVFINGIQTTQNVNAIVGSATYGDYYFRSSDILAPNASTALSGSFLDFEASTVIGLPSDAQIEIVNSEVKFIGTSATATRNDYLDGCWIPKYGLGLFSNYASGSHPRNVSLYQNRLVFSGFPELPLTVVFSNVFDSVSPGINYNSFQIDTFAIADTDAIDITLASSPDDLVRGIIDWQNNLFVLTRKAVFRISGGQNTFTQRNKFSVFVSNIGLVNPYSLVRTDRSIVYLSDIGVFDLVIQQNTTEYETTEKSIKIRDRFGITTEPAYESLAWIAYDSANRFVFVGLPVINTTYTSDVLLVYNTFRESWTEYTTPIGFNGYIATSYVDRSAGVNFLLCCSLYRDVNNVPTDFYFVNFSHEKYIDFAEYSTGSGISATINTTPESYTEFSTTQAVHEYPTVRPRSAQWRAFDSFAITNIKDCTVTLDGLEQTFGSNWVKLPNGNIYLLANPGAGKTLRFTLRRPITEEDTGQATFNVTSPQNYQPDVVFVDNVLQVAGVGYTLSSLSGVKRVTLTAAANSVVIVGQAYPVMYTTPLFTQRSLSSLKRLRHVYAFFDNKLGQDSYGASDVNTASGQVAEFIAGQPKVRQNINFAVRYESDDDAENIYDVFGYQNLVWDDAQFDIDPPAYSYRRDGVFKEALQGTGYSYQLLIWSYDESAFILAGYQITADVKGNKYINWTRG